MANVCEMKNKPLDCIYCEDRVSLTANLTSMKIECTEFNIGANAIPNLQCTNKGKNNVCAQF